MRKFLLQVIVLLFQFFPMFCEVLEGEVSRGENVNLKVIGPASRPKQYPLGNIGKKRYREEVIHRSKIRNRLKIESGNVQIVLQRICQNAVADPGGHPGPVKISHKKDGR